MADAPIELPPRPRAVPRLVPGRIYFTRIIAFGIVCLIALFQILAVAIPREITNDFGVFEEVDPIGIAFWLVGGLLNGYMIITALYVRRQQSKGVMHGHTYLPHPGFLLALDICIMGGCLGWGGLSTAFSFLARDGIYIAYSLGMLFLGLVSLLIIIIDDSRFVHYRRKDDIAARERRKQEVVLNSVGA